MEAKPRISAERLARICHVAQECQKDGATEWPTDLLAFDLRDARAECAELAKANGLALARLAEVERERDEAQEFYRAAMVKWNEAQDAARDNECDRDRYAREANAAEQRVAALERERDEARHALAVRAEHAVGLLASIASMSAEIAAIRARGDA